MNKNTLTFILIFISFSALGQQSKTDTTYYQGLEVINDKNNFTTFEICEIDKKGRRNGLCERFSKAGKLVESSNYKKGLKNGAYVRYSPLQTALIKGQYINELMEGAWLTFDIKGNLNTLEIYENDKLLSAREIDIKAISKTDETGVNVVEKKPEFPGGQNSWNKFLAQNMEYPTEAKRSGIQGTVLVKFIVSREGKIILPLIIESPHPSFNEEVLRILNLSSDWIPATRKGEAVDAEMQLKLNFRQR